jgi:hypothetical protein
MTDSLSIDKALADPDSDSLFCPSSGDLEPDTGDYEKDSKNGFYDISWDSFELAILWMKKKEEELGVEFRKKEKKINKGKKKHGWLIAHVWVCSRQGTGGVKSYEKKHPERGRKVPPKRTEDGCGARIIVRIYPNTTKVRGHYHNEHSHPTGKDNLRFTSLSVETRLRIADMLRMGVSKDKIV